MKKIFVAIMSIIVFCTIILFGCNLNEPRYTAEEWEKIQEDEEYLNIRDEIIEFDKEYNRMAEEFNNKKSSLDDNFGSDSKKEAIEFLNQLEELTVNFKNEFQKLRTPEPLDDFYYLKLEELDWVLKEYEHIALMFEINPSKDSFIGLNLIEDWGDQKVKIDNLKLEADKEKRKVYREYDLDDLLESN